MDANKQKMNQVNYLDNLPGILNSLELISCHGRGMGGGEVVFEKILNLYKKESVHLQTITSTENFFQRVKTVSGIHKNKMIFLTAGIRDLDVIAYCILLRRRFTVYVQVPYYKSCNLKADPVHFMLVKTYLFLIRIFSKTIFVNSTDTLGFKSSKTYLLLPVNSTEIVKKKVPVPKLDKSPVIIGTASRLTVERGIGSKDFEGLIEICIEIDKILSLRGIEFKILHFGQFDNDLANKIHRRFAKIEFCGYNKNWINEKIDLFIFNSRYEGFGLAPLEASAVRPVFVNDAFPRELFDCSVNIYPITDLFRIL